MIRSWDSLRFALATALVLLLCAPASMGQDPKDAKAKARAEREAKAQKLFDDGKAAFDAGKHSEAQTALKELRDKFGMTSVYFTNSQDIRSMLLQCGYKLAASALQAQKPSKKQHIDTILGIRFNPPDTWRGIPNWQELYNERDTSEAEHRDKSYRCARYTSRFLETLYMNVYKTYAPTDVKAVAEGAFKTSWSEPKGLEMISEDQIKGLRYQNLKQIWKDEAGNRYAIFAFFDPVLKKGFGITGYWRITEEGLGWIVITGGAKEAKLPPPADQEWAAAVKVFEDTARTFEIMDQGTLSQMRMQAKSWGIETDGWCVKVPDWNILQTRNYTIEYACRKDFAERLGQELEQILKLYQQTIPSQKAIARGRVKLFDCEEDFQYYGQSPGAAAYWSPWQREIVAYRFEGRKVKAFEGKEEMTVAEEKNPEEVTFNIIYHEAFHQYMENMMGLNRNVYVPSWVNEGMGDYFFGGQWTKDKKFVIGLNDWRLETIVKAVKENKHVRLKKLFYYTQNDYYSDAGLCYAQGWAICYYFMSEEGKKLGYNRYITGIYEWSKKIGDDWGNDAKKVTDKVFEGADFDKIEANWKAFVLGLEKHLPQEARKSEEGN